ncbi:N-acetylglucosamine-6-phosphate deacetylase [Calidifontibacter terrae]
MLLHAQQLITGTSTDDGVVSEGWVRVDDGRVTEVGHGPAPGAPDISYDGTLAPAYVDIHCHGGGGGDFASADADAVRTAAAHHAAHGTGAMLASLVTAPVDDLCRQLAVIADVVEAGDSVVAGAHLEGPFLSAARCGAQNPAHLVDPDVAAFDRMVEAARGKLRMITVAPELPGAVDLIRAARRAGVVVAIGHTDATYDQCRPALDAGATVATHLFNGMRPIHHREPGPPVAALDASLWCELINDGIHLDPAIVRTVHRTIGDRTVLVTDAMSATGLPDGVYELGGLAVTVVDGAARLTDSGGLAGSTLTMDDAVRRAVTDGIPLAAAIRAATIAPATAVGLTGSGRIVPGARADLLHLAADGSFERVPTDLS